MYDLPTPKEIALEAENERLARENHMMKRHLESLNANVGLIIESEVPSLEVTKWNLVFQPLTVASTHVRPDGTRALEVICKDPERAEDFFAVSIHIREDLDGELSREERQRLLHHVGRQLMQHVADAWFGKETQ